MDTTQTAPVNHISLCAGYAGIDLGLRRVIRGLRTIALSEIEAFACANLVAKMEAGLLDAAPIWSNLKTFPWTSFRGRVGLLSGGFPCQPFSAAGKRGGDEDPRHLFPYILRGITECQPDLVFLENVEGIISAKLAGTDWRDPAGTPVLLHVLRELERVGYWATAGVFSSAEIGASHQRKRIFILAQRMANPLHDGHPTAERPSGARPSGARPSGARPSENQGWLRQPEGVGSPQRNVLLRPKPPGPDQWWWEPARVIQSFTRIANRHGRFVADTRCGQCERGSDSKGTESTPQSVAGETGSVGDSALVQRDGSHDHSRVSVASRSLSQSGDPSRSVNVANDTCVGRGEGWSQRGGEQGRSDAAECSQPNVGNPSNARLEGAAGASLQGRESRFTRADRRLPQHQDGSTQPSLGRDPDGSACGLDYAQLETTVDNRTDELRLLGNGVDPDVVAKAFVTLYNQLNP